MKTTHNQRRDLKVGHIGLENKSNFKKIDFFSFDYQICKYKYLNDLLN